MMDDRPLFRDETSFRDLYDERLPFYRQADLRVEGGGSPRQVVEHILASEVFGRRGSPSVGASGGDFAGEVRPQSK